MGWGTQRGVPNSLTPLCHPLPSSVVNYEGGAVCAHARSLWRLEPLRIRYGGHGVTRGWHRPPGTLGTLGTLGGIPPWGLGVLECHWDGWVCHQVVIVSYAGVTCLYLLMFL